ncbi:MAG: transporter ATP-binding protein [Ilumatobacteraceae bacterium]|nr:transporter ATP-binding protein [Ilumatobacteraceae bacterium]
MTARLDVVDVTKLWADGSGLRPTSFTAMPGELVVVRGRSGSGKSTLLGILAALCAPDAGTIMLDGVPLGTKPRPWTDVTLVPQTFALAVELTLRENVRDAVPEVSADELNRLLDELSLDVVAGATPDVASMGEQQRCAVARALTSEPLVLLADEPTSHQDADRADAVVGCLLAAAQRGTTVVIATHDRAFAQVATVLVDLEID